MPYLQFQLRHDTAANWTLYNPVLLAGEMGIETDTGQFKIGDGTTAWASLAYGGLRGPTGSGSWTLGTTTIDFGAAPGTNVTTVNVTGQSGILSTSMVTLQIMGNDSTADHNAYEHGIVPLVLRPTAVTAGVGFTIEASSEWRLTGTFKVRWAWQ